MYNLLLLVPSILKHIWPQILLDLLKYYYICIGDFHMNYYFNRVSLLILKYEFWVLYNTGDAVVDCNIAKHMESIYIVYHIFAS